MLHARFVTFGCVAVGALALATVGSRGVLAARAEISGCLNQVFTFYLPIEWLDRRSHDDACQNCHKRAKHPLN